MLTAQGEFLKRKTQKIQPMYTSDDEKYMFFSKLHAQRFVCLSVVFCFI